MLAFVISHVILLCARYLFAQMAPEVGRGQPYNELCDVYSFGVLLWEMMALCKPYGKTDMTDMVKEVWQDCPGAKRPSPSLVKKGRFMTVNGLQGLWRRHANSARYAASLQSLVASCWSYTLDDRPTMSTVENLLSKELMGLPKDKDGGKGRRHFSSASTFNSDDDEGEEN